MTPEARARRNAHRRAIYTPVYPIAPDALVPAGASKGTLLAYARLAQRREVYGPTCMSPQGLANIRASLRAHPRRHRATHCCHGHKYTPANTYVDPRHRQKCRACRRLADHRARWRRLVVVTQLARLKRAMLAAHPDAGGTSAKFIAACRRYRAACRRFRRSA